MLNHRLFQRPQLVGLLTNISLFSTPAFTLVLDSGYTYGPALLLLLTIGYVFSSRVDFKTYELEDKLLMLGFVIYFMTHIALWYREGFAMSEIDKPLRMILAAGVLIFLLKTKLKPDWFFWGCTAGAIGAGLIACYQFFILDVARPSGHMITINFGDNSLLLSLLSLVAAGFFYINRNYRGAVVAILATFGGWLAFIMSGTKGGWLAVPLFAYIIWHYRGCVSKKALLSTLVLLIGFSVLVLANPKISVVDRFDGMLSNLNLYEEANITNTSVAIRLELWKSAWYSFSENPLMGTSDANNRSYKQAQIEEDLVAPVVLDYDHSHNDILTVMAFSGIIGLLGLMAIYIIPMILFTKLLRKLPEGEKPFALAGAIVCLAYVLFGMTNAMFSHNSSVMIYSFYIVLLWACVRRGVIDRQSREGSVSSPLST